MPDTPPDAKQEQKSEQKPDGGRLRRLGKRLFREVEATLEEVTVSEPDEPSSDTKDTKGEAKGEAKGERGGRSLRIDAWEALSGVLETSDRAKTEIVRIVAREVRNYLEEVGLKDDVRNLLNNYSLDIHLKLQLTRRDPPAK